MLSQQFIEELSDTVNEKLRELKVLLDKGDDDNDKYLINLTVYDICNGFRRLFNYSVNFDLKGGNITDKNKLEYQDMTSMIDEAVNVDFEQKLKIANVFALQKVMAVCPQVVWEAVEVRARIFYNHVEYILYQFDMNKIGNENFKLLKLLKENNYSMMTSNDPVLDEICHYIDLNEPETIEFVEKELGKFKNAIMAVKDLKRNKNYAHAYRLLKEMKNTVGNWKLSKEDRERIGKILKNNFKDKSPCILYTHIDYVMEYKWECYESIAECITRLKKIANE